MKIRIRKAKKLYGDFVIELRVSAEEDMFGRYIHHLEEVLGALKQKKEG